MANMWMVRAGENAFLIDDFKEMDIVAVGWEIGDLSGKTKEEIKQLMAETYPNVSKTSLSLKTAQIIKFVHDFEIGDYVISYNPDSGKYLVGRIISDYYYSDKLAKKYNQINESYNQFRDVEWIGETDRDILTQTSLKPLKSKDTIFNLNDSAKNEILYCLNNDKIEWTDFYMEFGEKLLEYKNNRSELISKIQNVFNNIDISLPTLDQDTDGNVITPTDMDPFTVFALFNKRISYETRINIISGIKDEFSLKNEVPNSFHGIAAVNNLKATFYWFTGQRGEDDIDNLWNLYELAINESIGDEFIELYNKVLTQNGIRWNITMGLNWIKPFTFINLDSNNRELLSTSEIFSSEFKDKIKSLKSPPDGEEYLKICEEAKNALKNSQFKNFPELSHSAYLISKENPDEPEDGIGDSDVKTTHYWLISAGFKGKWWDEFYQTGEVGIGFSGTGDLSQYESKEELKYKFQEINGDNNSHVNNVHACWQFVHDMQIGDVIFVKTG